MSSSVHRFLGVRQRAPERAPPERANELRGVSSVAEPRKRCIGAGGKRGSRLRAGLEVHEVRVVNEENLLVVVELGDATERRHEPLREIMGLGKSERRATAVQR